MLERRHHGRLSRYRYSAGQPNHWCSGYCCNEGPLATRSGLLENAYEACLAHELKKQGWQVARQVGLPVIYDGQRIELGYRIDLIVENLVLVEVKCVEAINPVREAQLLSYIRLSGRNVGLLINFHVAHLRDGIRRMVDGKDWER